MTKNYKHNFIDPIHGSIPFTDEEKKIIDSIAFQRLRNIYQLGNAQFLFPTAVHSRFSHSIGVMHVATRLFDAIFNIKDKDFERRVSGFSYLKKIIRLSALMHDVGHGPFSHFFEKILHEKNLKDRDLDSSLKISLKWFYKGQGKKYLEEQLEHEHYSIGVIKNVIKNNNLAKDICSVLNNTIKHSSKFEKALRAIAEQFGSNNTLSLKKCLKSIISSEIDADRLDYLKRDTYFTGAKIANIDIDHLIDSISLDTQEQNFFIRVNFNAVSAIDQILISRKQMFNQLQNFA
jgi:HD superfamily phosphohydrolase